MIDQSLESLTGALRDSEFLRTLLAVRPDGGTAWALADEPVRPLRDAEIRRLVADGNSAEDWGLVRVAEWFRPGLVKHNEFLGNVTLGQFEGVVRGPGDIEFPAGVYRSTISNSVVGHNALVRNVGLLAGCAVGNNALLSDCGRVMGGLTTFGNGIAIPIGPQCGGRWLRLFAEISLDLATALTSPKFDRGLDGRYTELLEAYLRMVQGTRTVIGGGARITNVPVLQNVYIGPGAVVDAATRIADSTLLSSAEEPVRVSDGACITESVIQWGVEIRGPAAVERSALLEHASVERFGKIADSVIGPNSGIGGAEVASSLIGPFVSCHHQGLLIAARWPGGRGNLGYGAAAGCNHTSRAPDQEAVLGEGLFIGLGAQLQYPVDFSRAPYSVVASGVNVPPQRLAFPFSLLRSPTESIPDVPPGAHLLIPAWVLSDNLYAVQRSAFKFRNRDRAMRHRLSYEVFRPDIMALVSEALHRLEHPAREGEVYTEREISGLGRCVLLERHRAAAIRCYSEHLERFQLLRWWERFEKASSTEFDREEIRERLSRLVELSVEFAESVERSKQRDEKRGAQIIDDYAAAHEPTRDDPVVRESWEEVARMREQVAQVLAARGRHTAVTALAGS